MFPRGDQMLTVQRAVDGDFAFGAAADRTNVAANAGTKPARRACLTESAFGTFHERLDLTRNLYRIIRCVKRIDVHIKVVIDLEDGENERRLAAEICRVIEKVYGVRRAEVSNIVSASGE